MYKSINAFMLAGVLLLSACGGGSSSGGGSGITYAGTFSLTVVGGGNAKGTFNATINGDNVTLRFSDGTTFSGKADRFDDVRRVSFVASIVGVVDGCTEGVIKILVFYNLVEGRFSGAITGENIVCNGADVKLVGHLKGTPQ